MNILEQMLMEWFVRNLQIWARLDIERSIEKGEVRQ